MRVSKGDVIFHVGSSGAITKVNVLGPEYLGSVSVQFPNGTTAQMGSMHLFCTIEEANIVAMRRASPRDQEIVLIRSPLPPIVVTKTAKKG